MESNNKRIAKNTVFLYIRMLLNMGITFYTSRVILNTLGIDDFGIYGVVGGIIAMFSFLNSSMAGTTSRFLTFELGKDNYEKLQKTFSAALTIHFIIAMIILVLSETAGFWWLENKLVITPERINAVRWVFHLSVLGSVITIIQVPYNATIIAHERMNVYAYVEILNSLLKLGIVFLLVIGNFDKLILYAVLTLCITIIITTIYKIYCARNFPESHYKFHWNKEIIKPILGFSGWDLFGNLSQTTKTQGVNILLNLFFGVAVNASYGIATQVQGAVQSFSNSFLTAVRPQIVKYYATNEIEKMQNLMIHAAKFSFLLIYIITLPILFETHFLLRVWLKQIPGYVIVFSQLNLLSVLITCLFANSVVVYAIHSTGKIKNLSIIGGTIYLFTIPISYFFIKIGFSPVTPFVVNAVLMLIYSVCVLFILKYLIPEISVMNILMKVSFICISVVVLSSVLPVYFYNSLDEGWYRFILVEISSVLSISLAGYFIVLNKEMRTKVVNVVLHKMKKLKYP